MDETSRFAKKNAGILAADKVKDGMVVGLGTGSTIFFAMEALGLRINEGLSIYGIPTSYQAEFRARSYGIPVTTLCEHPTPDLTIDGADQVNPYFQMIKGRGAAQTREKVVAYSSKELIIVIDETKQTKVLNTLVPLEVLPFALKPCMDAIIEANGMPTIRTGQKKDGPVITDNGNFIIDCDFGEIHEPERVEDKLTFIPGSLSSGLFTKCISKTKVIVGHADKAVFVERIV